MNEEQLARFHAELLTYRKNIEPAIAALPANDELTVELTTLRDDLDAMIKIAEDAKSASFLSTAGMDMTCAVREATPKLRARCLALKDKLKVLKGLDLDVPGLPWTWVDYALLGAVLVGGYYAYRVIFGGRSIMDLFGHSSDEYPKAKLPRYAGGKRRL